MAINTLDKKNKPYENPFLDSQINSFDLVNSHIASKVNSFELEDKSIVSSLIHETSIDKAIHKFLEYNINNFDCNIATLWVPCPDNFDDNIANKFVMLREYSTANNAALKDYANKTLERLKNKPFSTENSITGEIMCDSNRHESISFNENLHTAQGLINSPFEKYNKLISIPIQKTGYYDSPHESLWGVVCLRLSNEFTLNPLDEKRFNTLGKGLQIVIESFIGKDKQMKVLQFGLNLDRLNMNDEEAFYKNLMKTFNHIQNSEHSSIFFTDTNEEKLILKASSSDKFYTNEKPQNSNTEVTGLIAYDLADTSEITTETFLEGRIKVINRPKFLKKKNKYFTEDVKTLNNMILACIHVNKKAKAVIRAVNKKEDRYRQQFSHLFTYTDKEFIVLVIKIIERFISNFEFINDKKQALLAYVHESNRITMHTRFAIQRLNKRFKQEVKTELSENWGVTFREQLEFIAGQNDMIVDMAKSLEYLYDGKMTKANVKYESIPCKELFTMLKQTIDNKSFLALNEKGIGIKNNTLFLKQYDFYLTLDLDQFKHAFGNILDNAVKDSYSANEMGKDIHVSCNLLNENEQRVDKVNEFYWLELEVQNFGFGILEEDKEKIFSRNYRGSNVKKTAIYGRGIGLGFTKEIIEAHKGKLIISSLDNPTIFVIRLPIRSKSKII